MKFKMECSDSHACFTGNADEVLDRLSKIDNDVASIMLGVILARLSDDQSRTFRFSVDSVERTLASAPVCVVVTNHEDGTVTVETTLLDVEEPAEA